MTYVCKRAKHICFSLHLSIILFKLSFTTFYFEVVECTYNCFDQMVSANLKSGSSLFQHRSFVAVLIHIRPFHVMVTSTQTLEHQMHSLSVSTLCPTASDLRCECAACGWNACPLRSPPLPFQLSLHHSAHMPNSSPPAPHQTSRSSVRSSVLSSAPSPAAVQISSPHSTRTQCSGKSSGGMSSEWAPLTPAVVRSSVSFALSPPAALPRRQRPMTRPQPSGPLASSSPTPAPAAAAVAASPLCVHHTVPRGPQAAHALRSAAPLSSPLHVHQRAPLSPSVELTSSTSSSTYSRSHSPSPCLPVERSPHTSSSTLCSICDADADSQRSQVLPLVTSCLLRAPPALSLRSRRCSSARECSPVCCRSARALWPTRLCACRRSRAASSHAKSSSVGRCAALVVLNSFESGKDRTSFRMVLSDY